MRRTILPGAVVAAAMILCGNARASIYYVALDGNDAKGDGSIRKPWRTLQKAADSVGAGDTVIVRPGIYSAANGNNVSIGASGAPGKPVTFRSETKWGARIDGRDENAAVGFYVNASYVTIQDFDISGQTSMGARSNPGNHDLLFSGNKFHDIGRICTDTPYGIAGFFGNNGAGVTLSDNVFHDIGRLGPGENGCAPRTLGYQNLDHGVYLASVSDVDIRDNLFFNIRHGWCIQIYDGDGGVTDLLRVRGNKFVGPSGWRDGQILIASPTRNSVIEGNVFIGASGRSIEFYEPGEQRNNIARGNVSYPQDIGAPRQGWSFTNNRTERPSETGSQRQDADSERRDRDSPQ